MVSIVTRRGPIPTADLMKKGLRLHPPGQIPAIVIPTADLMKKGLRPIKFINFSSLADSNRRPDEEGIKTHLEEHQ